MIPVSKPEKGFNGYLKITQENWNDLIDLIMKTRNVRPRTCQDECYSNVYYPKGASNGPITRVIYDLAEHYFCSTGVNRAKLLIPQGVLTVFCVENEMMIFDGDIIETPYGRLCVNVNQLRLVVVPK